MPKPSAATFHLIYGGDPYLNEQAVRDLRHQAQRKHPDAETIELDATNADHYAFDEASVSDGNDGEENEQSSAQTYTHEGVKSN